MSELVKKGNYMSPMLFPMDPEQFWQLLRKTIQEEVSKLQTAPAALFQYETPGLTYKPLYKMAEVCNMFQVSKPTIYDWIKRGKLHPHKIRSRVYFLWQDIQPLLQPNVANSTNV